MDTVDMNTGTARAMTRTDRRWTALETRDARADGTFFYSVSTTGVYCRPSCASRAARPEHVAFHDTAADAERAGFRPCKRCRPDEPSYAERQTTVVAGLCRFIETRDAPPTLAELAEEAGLSPHHVHRLFKKVTGVTPKAYADAHRATQVRVHLGNAHTVTEAIYDAGYGSSGRFYAQSTRRLGMTPTSFRRGGEHVTIRSAIGRCSLGSVLVGATDQGVCAILIGDDTDALARDLARRFPRASIVPAGDDFNRVIAQVVALVEDPAAGSGLPLDIRGTAFQQRVWSALVKVPAGRTTTYSELASAMGSPGAVRAVAGACAANPIAIIIPCHRVIRRDGDISGYRWGVERKRTLLAREARPKPAGT